MQIRVPGGTVEDINQAFGKIFSSWKDRVAEGKGQGEERQGRGETDEDKV